MKDFAIVAYTFSGGLLILALILEWLSGWQKLSVERRRNIDDYLAGAGVLFFLSLPVSLVAFILTHIEAIYNVISSYWFLPVAVLVGLILFSFRCRAPFWYGLIELLASWVMIWIAIVTPIVPVVAVGGQPVSFGIPLLAKGTTLLAGIYVSVRGLDNIDKDVPQRFQRIWGKVFRKKVKPAETAADTPRAIR
jgi:hypothetical protein